MEVERKMDTVNVLLANGYKRCSHGYFSHYNCDDYVGVFFDKLAELIYAQMTAKTGIFAKKSNWKE